MAATIGALLSPQALDIDHLAAAADLTQRLMPFPVFRIGERKPLQLALEAEGLLLDLEGGLQRGGFRSQLPPQPEGDLFEPGVGIGGDAKDLLVFVLAHRTQHTTRGGFPPEACGGAARGAVGGVRVRLSQPGDPAPAGTHGRADRPGPPLPTIAGPRPFSACRRPPR